MDTRFRIATNGERFRVEQRRTEKRWFRKPRMYWDARGEVVVTPPWGSFCVLREYPDTFETIQDAEEYQQLRERRLARVRHGWQPCGPDGGSDG